jgi:hypothetical protein
MSPFPPGAPKVFTVGDPEPDCSPGTVAAVRYADYRRQEIWVSSGANIGNWYPLGGEFGIPKVAEDPRTPMEKLISRDRWRQPPGTVPLHPHWEDIVARGPVTLLVPGQADAYATGWADGRARLFQQMDELRDEEDTPPGYGWRAGEQHPTVRSQVNDLIGPNATDIPADVLEFEDSEGDVWRRPIGEERYIREDDGTVNRDQEYDWVSPGGWSTTEGRLAYTPLRVTKVAGES